MVLFDVVAFQLCKRREVSFAETVDERFRRVASSG